MPRRLSDEDRSRILKGIIDKHAPAFKYELTRLHLSEDQIEVIFPSVVKLIDQVNRDYAMQIQIEE